MQSCVCRPLTQCRLWKTTALAAEPDRPVSCCMAALTMRLGGRTSLHAGRLVPLLDHRPRDLRPLVERHLIMIKERVFIGRFRRPRLGHVTCGSDMQNLDRRPEPPEGSLGGVISSGRASQHPFNGRLHRNGYPAKLIDKPRISYRRLAWLQRRPHRSSRCKLPPRFARFDSLPRGINVSAGASEEIGRARPHLS